MHVASGNWRRGLTLSLVTVFFWGLLPIALKGLLVSMDVLTITWYRFLVSSLVMGLWLGRGAGFPRPGELRGRVGILTLLACLGLTGNYGVYLTGLGHITPATAQVVIQLAPLSLMLGGIVIFRERFSRIQALGVAIFLSGLGLFFHDHLHELLGSFGAYARGVGMVVLAALLWALYSLAQKQLLTRFPSSVVLWMVYTSGALVYLPVAQPGSLLELDARGLVLLAFCCGNTLGAYGAFAEALESWEASRVSAVIATTPLATACFAEATAWLVPGMVPPESWSLASIAGALLVATGSAVTALGRVEAPQVPEPPAQTEPQPRVRASIAATCSG